MNQYGRVLEVIHVSAIYEAYTDDDTEDDTDDDHDDATDDGNDHKNDSYTAAGAGPLVLAP